MGAGIAQACLQSGHEVLLHDVDEAAIERGRSAVAEGLARLVAKGRVSADDLTALLGDLRDAHSLADVTAEAELVMEAALEDLGLKQTIFRALDSAAARDVPLATNTSALSVTEIAASAERYPGRVLGLHFFNPAPVMPLVEVVAAETTDAAALDAGRVFAEGLGKTAVVCRDSPGFIVNRVNRPFTLEALRMVEAGEATVEEIDHAVEAAGYPMGPFRLMDLVGIDINYAVAQALYRAFEEEERFRPSVVQEQMVAAGRLGRKSRGGFYDYADPGGRSSAAALGGSPADPAMDRRELPASDPSLAIEAAEIVTRIELAIINEAYHAAGENVATPPDIDRALKLGANHPRGPFERARELGLRSVIDDLRRLEERHGRRFRVAPALWQVATV